MRKNKNGAENCQADARRTQIVLAFVRSFVCSPNWTPLEETAVQDASMRAVIWFRWPPVWLDVLGDGRCKGCDFETGH